MFLVNYLHPTSVHAAGTQNSQGEQPQNIQQSLTANDAPTCGDMRLGQYIPMAATVLGVFYDDLWVALHQHKTVADIAVEQGLSEQFVITELIKKETARLISMLANGCIIQEEFATHLAQLDESVREFYHDETPPWFVTCRMSFHDRYQTAANLFGMDYFDLVRQIEDGAHLLAIAIHHQITAETLEETLIQTELEGLENWVAAGCVAKSDAQLWVKIIPFQIGEFLIMPEDHSSLGQGENDRKVYLPLLLN